MDYGIVWEADRKPERLGTPPTYREWSGMAVFATQEDRAVAIRELVETFGADYIVTYRDAQGHGLSYALRCGSLIDRSRPEAKDRLPSVRRARREERARRAFQRSIYRHPSYDPVH